MSTSISRRLNAIDKQRQAIADRKAEAILRELSLLSDEDLNEAMKECYKQQPEYKDNPDAVERLFAPENEHELREHLRAELRPERSRK